MLHDLARGVSSPLSPTGTDPIWSPDDREVAFALQSTTAGGIYAMPAFGGEKRPLFVTAMPVYPEDWSLDGQSMAAVYRSGRGRRDSLSGQGPSPSRSPQGPTAHTIDEPRFSPDAKWLAFGVVRSSGTECSLRHCHQPASDGSYRLAAAPSPAGNMTARQCHFLSLSGTLMKVDVTLTPGARPKISAPRPVMETGLQVQTNARSVQSHPERKTSSRATARRRRRFQPRRHPRDRQLACSVKNERHASAVRIGSSRTET